MRKVTEQTCTAFIEGSYKKIGNTEATSGTLRLFDNLIAKREGRKIFISNAGYITTTTKDRLNGLLYLLGLGMQKIYQRDGTWYWLDGVEFPTNKFVEVKFK